MILSVAITNGTMKKGTDAWQRTPDFIYNQYVVSPVTKTTQLPLNNCPVYRGGHYKVAYVGECKS